MASHRAPPLRVLAVAAAALLLPALAGCLQEPDRSLVFTSLTTAEPVSLDPAISYETSGGGVLQNVYQTLIYYNGSSATELAPVLVEQVPSRENGLLREDGTQYTFRLRPEARFSDGTPVTADDVKFSLDRAILMNEPSSPAWISGVIAGADAYMATEGTPEDRQAYFDAGGVVVLDPRTVRVTLSRPDPAFLYKLAYTHASIVNRAAFLEPHAERLRMWGTNATADGFPPPARGGEPRVSRDPWAERNVAGSGPFVLDRWVPGDKVILRRNANYWFEPKPAMEFVVLQKATDVNSQLFLLQRGWADDVNVGPADAMILERFPFARVLEQPSFQVAAMALTRNITDPDHCPRDARTGAPDCRFFDDVHMRRAWTYAFDYEHFAEKVAHGHAERIAGVVPRGMYGHHEGLQPVQQDLARAREELAKSRHPDGFHITISYVGGLGPREGAVAVLREALQELSPGIEVKAEPLDWASALLPMARKGALAAYFVVWAPDYAFPDNYVVPFGHSQRGMYAAWARLGDKELDAMIDKAVAEPDAEAAREQYLAIQERMAANADYIYVAQLKVVHVEGPWVQGYTYNPMDSNAPLVGHYERVRKGPGAP